MVENRTNIKTHSVFLENREEMKITGVEEVDSYNENSIVLSTIKGGISIKGEGMSINKLNLDEGSLRVAGTINSLIYISKGGEPKNFIGKLFK